MPILKIQHKKNEALLADKNKEKVNSRFIDLLVMVAFFIIALAYTLGHVGTHFQNYLILTGDAANISCFAAGLDHPQFFINDPLLKDQANFAWYYTVHIPLIRFLGHVLGNYGSAFAFLIFPITFLHLLGYYLLGKSLLKNRSLSLFFTLAAMVPLKLNLGEIWGLSRFMIPRILFQALLPFVLVAVIKWGKNLRAWPWLMACTGLLVYAHPVSLPAWGLAIFLSLWFLVPEVSSRQKMAYLLLAVLIFLIVITPFTINYLSSTTFGSGNGENYENILSIMQKRFSRGYLQLEVGLKEFVKKAVFSHWLNQLLWLLVLLGGIGVFFNRRRFKNPAFTVIVAWWVGIFSVGVLAPVADHTLAAAFKRMPMEVDLIRSLRYMIPLLLLSVFYLLSELRGIVLKKMPNCSTFFISAGIASLGLCLMFGWMLRYQFFQDRAFAQTARCWSSGRLTCPLPNEENLARQVELLQVIRSRTPLGARILSMNENDLTTLAIRYYSLRSLVFHFKDGAAFIYANHKALLAWWQQFQNLSKLKKNSQREPYLDALMEFARNNRTDYLVFPEGHLSGAYYPPGLKNVFTNPGYSLYEVVH